MFYLCNSGGNLEDAQITMSNWGTQRHGVYDGNQTAASSTTSKTFTVCDSSGKAGQVYMIFWMYTSTDGQQGWESGGSWDTVTNCKVLRTKTIFSNDNGENITGAYGNYARNSLNVTFVEILNDGQAKIKRTGFRGQYGRFRFYSSLLSYKEQD